MALPNYVKFLRGTVASYNRLAVKDDNTLYFVYQDGDNTKGRLYLGNRLISGDIGGEGVNTLAELTDVIITGADAGSFLVLNSDGNWVATSASDVAQTILEAGGNFISVDDKEFQFNSVDGKLELKGYASAASGMIPVKGDTGIVWQNAPVDLSDRVGTLEGKVSTLESDFQAVDSKIANAIANASHLTYQVISNLNDATEPNTVYLYSKNSEDPFDRYEEYMLVNGSLEQIGTLSVDLSDYVTTTDLNTALQGKADQTSLNNLSQTIGDQITSINDTLNSLDDTYVTKTLFNATVGSLSDLANYNTLDYSNDASITDTLIDIYERLTWQEISS